MTLEERTREAVRAELERLVDRYGEVEVDRQTVTNEPELFEQGRQLAREGWLGDAGVWVTDDEGRVLLIRHEGAPDTWGTPGGGHDPATDDGLDATASRTLTEQTGVEADLSSLDYARWQTIVNDADADDRLHMLSVEFEGTAVSTDITEGKAEHGILAAAWFRNLPESLHEIPGRKAAEAGEADDTE
ncbi:NUDIX hydrolase [Halomicroarcula sp. GCM10025709]|uniref:NUDIX hydrolase n=1 Tax=Haloarcula TaxID=2237 RepID=UPI0024C27BDC|nr:NUDIX domain-containing protein [Halomicroarcula sp. YJ-61-S]